MCTHEKNGLINIVLLENAHLISLKKLLRSCIPSNFLIADNYYTAFYYIILRRAPTSLSLIKIHMVQNRYKHFSLIHALHTYLRMTEANYWCLVLGIQLIRTKTILIKLGNSPSGDVAASAWLLALAALITHYSFASTLFPPSLCA